MIGSLNIIRFHFLPYLQPILDMKWLRRVRDEENQGSHFVRLKADKPKPLSDASTTKPSSNAPVISEADKGTRKEVAIGEVYCMYPTSDNGGNQSKENCETEHVAKQKGQSQEHSKDSFWNTIYYIQFRGNPGGCCVCCCCILLIVIIITVFSHRHQ
jgi:hypothetical protein